MNIKFIIASVVVSLIFLILAILFIANVIPIEDSTNKNMAISLSVIFFLAFFFPPFLIGSTDYQNEKISKYVYTSKGRRLK